MRFGELFEFYKIPEWYNQYLNYEGFKTMIETFKEKQKEGEYMKLPGLYILSMKERRLICVDLI